MWEYIQLNIPFRDTAGSCRLDPVFSLLGASFVAAGSMEMALEMVFVTQIWRVGVPCSERNEVQRHYMREQFMTETSLALRWFRRVVGDAQ